MNDGNDAPLFVESCALVRSYAGIAEIFHPQELRHLDNDTLLSLMAATQTLRQAHMDLSAEKDLGLIITSSYGPAKRAGSFMDCIIDDGDLFLDRFGQKYSHASFT